jgi:hypothetical protein
MLSAILSASFPEESLCILSFLRRKSKDRTQEKGNGQLCARLGFFRLRESVIYKLSLSVLAEHLMLSDLLPNASA